MMLHERFNEQQWALLKQRARRVEKSVTTVDARDLVDVLIVRIARENYAIPVTGIQAVYEKIDIQALPSTPPHIAGIANVRGHVTTVLDIPEILDTPVSAIEGDGVLILLAVPGANVAVHVEQVHEVRRISMNDVSLVSNDHEEYIKGVLDDGSIMLDIQQIVDDPRLIVDES